MRGFWRGILTGGLLGLAAGLWAAPRLRPETRERLVQASRDWGMRARRVFQRTRREVEDALEGPRH